jgi:hypothetical protein
MSPLTTNSYVFALSSIQKCLGFNPIKIKNSQAEILLKDFKNQKLPSKSLRKPVTLKILSKLKSKIEKNFDNAFIKKAIWSVFTLAFFGCLRMGEIVCEKDNSFHSESAFCWGDVKTQKTMIKTFSFTFLNSLTKTSALLELFFHTRKFSIQNAGQKE